MEPAFGTPTTPWGQTTRIPSRQHPHGFCPSEKTHAPPSGGPASAEPASVAATLLVPELDAPVPPQDEQEDVPTTAARRRPTTLTAPSPG
jgi:hypothetical protein